MSREVWLKKCGEDPFFLESGEKNPYDDETFDVIIKPHERYIIMRDDIPTSGGWFDAKMKYDKELGFIFRVNEFKSVLETGDYISEFVFKCIDIDPSRVVLEETPIKEITLESTGDEERRCSGFCTKGANCWGHINSDDIYIPKYDMWAYEEDIEIHKCCLSGDYYEDFTVMLYKGEYYDFVFQEGAAP